MHFKTTWKYCTSKWLQNCACQNGFKIVHIKMTSKLCNKLGNAASTFSYSFSMCSTNPFSVRGFYSVSTDFYMCLRVHTNYRCVLLFVHLELFGIKLSTKQSWLKLKWLNPLWFMYALFQRQNWNHTYVPVISERWMNSF